MWYWYPHTPHPTLNPHPTALFGRYGNRGRFASPGESETPTACPA